MTSSDSAYDRAIGSIIGLAVGDTIGGPTEMAMVLGEHVAARGTVDPPQLFSDWLAWWKHGGFDTGSTSAKVFSLACSGIPAPQAVRQVFATSPRNTTAGCNPLHRSLILAGTSSILDNRLVHVSREQASLTHFDSLAGDVSAAGNVFGRQLILGAPLEDALTSAFKDWQGATMPRSFDELIDNGGSANVFRAALYFLRSTTSFETALHDAALFSGPPNYVPVVVGSWAGALYGISGIPQVKLGSPRVRHIAKLARLLTEGYR